MIRPLVALAFAAAWPVAASAGCLTSGTGAACVEARARPASFVPARVDQAEPIVEVGAALGRGEHSILINAEYYGLPPVSDGWVYMRIGHDAFRVDWRSHVVLERVTDKASANF